MLLTHEQIFMCENDKRKQHFLRGNSICKILFDNASGLIKPMLPNILNGNSRTVVPFPWMVLGGFVCSDKTPMSANSSKMKRSMQDGVGQTSETFEHLIGFIALALQLQIKYDNSTRAAVVRNCSGRHLCTERLGTERLRNGVG